jgi:hypothetical protein
MWLTSFVAETLNQLTPPLQLEAVAEVTLGSTRAGEIPNAVGFSVHHFDWLLAAMLFCAVVTFG